jgi:hypothetical protein
MPFEQRADHGLLADENDRHTQLRCGLYGPFHLHTGRMVTAHGINSDLDHAERKRLLFGHFEYFPILVVTAVGTGAMRQPQLMAIRAFRE